MNENSIVHLNHAGQARLPVRSAEAAKAVLDLYVRKGSLSLPEWTEIIGTARLRAAALIETRGDCIAFVSNTTTGIHLAMDLIPFEPGDRVLVAGAFPATIYPWKYASGNIAIPHFIPWETADDVMERIDAEMRSGRIRAVFADWVHYATGRVLPVEELYNLCLSHDAYLILDAIQGLGVLPSPVRHVDMLCAGGAKWLMGTEGTGIVYVDPNRRWNRGPLGWLSRRYESYSSLFPLRPPLDDAGRFESGTLNVPGIAALSESLNILLGYHDRFEIVSLLVNALREGAHIRGCETSVMIPESGIIGIRVTDPESVLNALTERGIRLSLREDWLRVSPHVVNTAEDIDRFWYAFDAVSS